MPRGEQANFPKKEILDDHLRGTTISDHIPTNTSVWRGRRAYETCIDRLGGHAARRRVNCVLCK